MISNIYLRSFFGLFSILIGVVLIKIYLDRDRDTLWGELFRLGAKPTHKEKVPFVSDKMYLALGVLGIVSGLIAILFGFRMVIVGT